MSTERNLPNDVNRVVRSWLREDRHEDADRVLGAVLDQVDTTPQRRSGWLARREFPMNKFVAIGLGAAAVIVAVFIGAQLIGQPPPGGEPSETPSPSATPAGSGAAAGAQDFLAQPQGTALQAGQYYFDHDAIPRVTLTVPAGWEKGMIDWVVFSSDGDKATLAVLSVNNLYADPCDPTLQFREPAVGPSVDDLVAALATVPGWEFSAPADVTVDGFAGQYVEYVSSAPAGDCPEPTLWQVDNGGTYPDQPAPGEGDAFRTWIVDVNGERLVLTTNSFPAVPENRVAELEEMIDSIQIE